jgi:hypothetical protein
MERAAVVLGFTVLVSWTGQSMSVQFNDLVPYLLGGSCLFPLLLALLRAMGSKSLMAASGCACASANDVDSTSGAAFVEALRRRKGWMAETVGLASLHKALAVRYGSSRRAMMSDVVLGWLGMRRRRGRDVLVNFSLGACRAGMAALQGSRHPDPLVLSSLPHAPAPAVAVIQSQSQSQPQSQLPASLFCG